MRLMTTLYMLQAAHTVTGLSQYWDIEWTVPREAELMFLNGQRDIKDNIVNFRRGLTPRPIKTSTTSLETGKSSSPRTVTSRPETPSSSGSGSKPGLSSSLTQHNIGSDASQNRQASQRPTFATHGVHQMQESRPSSSAPRTVSYQSGSPLVPVPPGFSLGRSTPLRLSHANFMPRVPVTPQEGREMDSARRRYEAAKLRGFRESPNRPAGLNHIIESRLPNIASLPSITSSETDSSDSPREPLSPKIIMNGSTVVSSGNPSSGRSTPAVPQERRLQRRSGRGDHEKSKSKKGPIKALFGAKSFFGLSSKKIAPQTSVHPLDKSPPRQREGVSVSSSSPGLRASSSTSDIPYASAAELPKQAAQRRTRISKKERPGLGPVAWNEESKSWNTGLTPTNLIRSPFKSQKLTTKVKQWLHGSEAGNSMDTTNIPQSPRLDSAGENNRLPGPVNLEDLPPLRAEENMKQTRSIDDVRLVPRSYNSILNVESREEDASTLMKRGDSNKATKTGPLKHNSRRMNRLSAAQNMHEGSSHWSSEPAQFSMPRGGRLSGERLKWLSPNQSEGMELSKLQTHELRQDIENAMSEPGTSFPAMNQRQASQLIDNRIRFVEQDTSKNLPESHRSIVKNGGWNALKESIPKYRYQTMVNKWRESDKHLLRMNPFTYLPKSSSQDLSGFDVPGSPTPHAVKAEGSPSQLTLENTAGRSKSPGVLSQHQSLKDLDSKSSKSLRTQANFGFCASGASKSSEGSSPAQRAKDSDAKSVKSFKTQESFDSYVGSVFKRSAILLDATVEQRSSIDVGRKLLPRGGSSKRTMSRRNRHTGANTSGRSQQQSQGRDQPNTAQSAERNGRSMGDSRVLASNTPQSSPRRDSTLTSQDIPSSSRQQQRSLSAYDAGLVDIPPNLPRLRTHVSGIGETHTVQDYGRGNNLGKASDSRGRPAPNVQTATAGISETRKAEILHELFGIPRVEPLRQQQPADASPSSSEKVRMVHQIFGIPKKSSSPSNQELEALGRYAFRDRTPSESPPKDRLSKHMNESLAPAAKPSAVPRAKPPLAPSATQIRKAAPSRENPRAVSQTGSAIDVAAGRYRPMTMAAMSTRRSQQMEAGYPASVSRDLAQNSSAILNHPSRIPAPSRIPRPNAARQQVNNGDSILGNTAQRIPSRIPRPNAARQQANDGDGILGNTAQRVPSQFPAQETFRTYRPMTDASNARFAAAIPQSTIVPTRLLRRPEGGHPEDSNQQAEEKPHNKHDHLLSKRSMGNSYQSILPRGSSIEGHESKTSHAISKMAEKTQASQRPSGRPASSSPQEEKPNEKKGRYGSSPQQSTSKSEKPRNASKRRTTTESKRPYRAPTRSERSAVRRRLSLKAANGESPGASLRGYGAEGHDLPSPSNVQSAPSQFADSTGRINSAGESSGPKVKSVPTRMHTSASTSSDSSPQRSSIDNHGTLSAAHLTEPFPRDNRVPSRLPPGAVPSIAAMMGIDSGSSSSGSLSSFTSASSLESTVGTKLRKAQF